MLALIGEAEYESLGFLLCALKTSRDFASNIEITFHTPEEYFLHEEPVPFTRSFEPRTFLNGSSSTSTYASLSNFSACVSGVH